MVVISIQVHLIDVPSGVYVVPIRIQHYEYVNFSVLQNINDFLLTFSPSVNVPLCCQPSQRGSKIFVTMVTSVDVDDFFCTAVGFRFDRPV